MILPGRIAYARGILSNIRCSKTQVQPCGIDLSLKQVLTLTSSGCIDFSNSQRQTSASTTVPFDTSRIDLHNEILPSVHLQQGNYLVEFNELIHMPLDIMGQIFVRSSLFRSGAQINAGVMDSGYEGVIGAMLTVGNPFGLRLYKDARLAQMVFHQLTEPTESYDGQYQARRTL